VEGIASLLYYQGLVALDKETSSIQLIHFTLQEYHQAHPELFGKAHSAMAETCLSCPNSIQVKTLSAAPSPDLQGTPFLEYPYLYWGMQAKRDLSDCAKSLALKIFDDYSTHVFTKILLEPQELYSYTLGFNGLFLFSGLHCGSLFGIDEIVACLVEVEGCDVNEEDCVGNTPLVLAAQNGHEGVVNNNTPQTNISSNNPDKNGQTPLECVALNGLERVVNIPLGRDGVNPVKQRKLS